MPTVPEARLSQRTVLIICHECSDADSEGRSNKSLLMPYPINPNEVCANVYVAHPLTLANHGGSKLPTRLLQKRTHSFDPILIRTLAWRGAP